MRECPKCQACYDGVDMRCALDSCDLVETVPCGRTIAAKYRIESRLGAGRLGAVYRATHLASLRTVALKMLVPHRHTAATLAAAFRRQASAARQLRHDNIVPVIDFGVIEANESMLGYIVMEFTEGWPLSALLRDQPRLSVAQAVALLEGVCAGLTYAHDQGIVHGGLKPQNIWLSCEGVSEEVVKLLDCGISQLVGDEALASLQSLTLAEAAEQSCRYLAPEQCQGRAPDIRSDVYSLGVVAYEMMAGAPPFVGEAEAVRRKHLRARPRSLWLWHRVPRKVSAVIHKALSKDPRQRHQSVTDFIYELRSAAIMARVLVPVS